MAIQKLKMKRRFQALAIFIMVAACAYLAIPADNWSDSRLLAFSLLWFVLGFWVAQYPKFWYSQPAHAADEHVPKG